MCGSMADIQSAAAEIRRGKERKKETRKKQERNKKPQGKNIMVCPITQGDHNFLVHIFSDLVILFPSYPFAAFGSWCESCLDLRIIFQHDAVVVSAINNSIVNGADA